MYFRFDKEMLKKFDSEILERIQNENYDIRSLAKLLDDCTVTNNFLPSVIIKNIALEI